MFRSDNLCSQTQVLGLMCDLKNLNSSPSICFGFSYESELNCLNGCRTGAVYIMHPKKTPEAQEPLTTGLLLKHN